MRTSNEVRGGGAARSRLLRDTNARLFDVQRGRTATSLLEFLCECSQNDCRSSLALTAAEYEAVRSGGDRFVVTRGHEAAAFEPGSELREHVTVVARTGAGRGVAPRLDRRRLRFTGVAATGRAGHGRPRPVG